MNRSTSTGKSRFGYNGKLKDNDLKGLGNSYDYGARFYDPRAGRFLSIDPLMREYPSNSSYLYADNRPIQYIDVDGKGADLPTRLEWDPIMELFMSPKMQKEFKTVQEITNSTRPEDIELVNRWKEAGEIALMDIGGEFAFMALEKILPQIISQAKKVVKTTGQQGKVVKVEKAASQAVVKQTTKAKVETTVKAEASAGVSKCKTTAVVPDTETPIPVTTANTTRGWHVGDPINNLTREGKVPSWSAVRERYWKNRAANAKPGEFSNANLERMKGGSPPQEFNKTTGKMESIELHHYPAQRDGGLFDFIEVTPSQHAKIDPYRKIGGK